MMIFTSMVCFEKNLQNAAPNSAHTKEPEAPMKDSITVNPISAAPE